LRLRNYRNEQKKLSELVKLRTSELENANTLLIDQNKQLDELNISKDKFFSIIAHDLKNPFSTIIGLSSVLIDNENGLNKEQQKELTRNIHSSTEKIYNLLENLLMWSSSQLNRIKITPSFYNLTNQIYNVISLFDDYATVKNIKIIFDENKEIIIYADMQMIETVVRNLITNAIKFSADNNNIKIELLEDDDKNICSIADQGIGMTSEQITNLFKLDKVTSTEGTRGERGTGLGLNLCLDFLEKNGGTIWVKSAPDKGSTFYFSVPTQKDKK
jgi:signal transduction histidine kinase